MDISPHSSPDSREPHDAMARRLRAEALAHRPAFSPQLHDRILNHIHGQAAAKPPHMAFRARQIVRYAAAIAILAVVLAASWRARPRRTSMPSNVVVKKNVQPRPQAPDVSSTPPSLEFRIAGVASGNLLPPRIEFQLPSLDLPRPDPQPTAINSTSADLPDRLLSGLRTPVASANESLTDVIPPNFRMLFPLVRPVVDRLANPPVN